MIKLPEETKSKLLLCDLVEGEIALITIGGFNHYVYCHKAVLEDELEAVSLTKKDVHYRVKDSNIVLLKVLKSGDTLEIA